MAEGTVRFPFFPFIPFATHRTSDNCLSDRFRKLNCLSVFRREIAYIKCISLKVPGARSFIVSTVFNSIAALVCADAKPDTNMMNAKNSCFIT